jgi:galacturan 1,4-alpha-galacturonidase
MQSNTLLKLCLLAQLTCVWSASFNEKPGVIYSSLNGRRQCTVFPHLNKTNDVPNILEAFQNCGNGGDIIFPENQNYWIAERMNPILKDVTIEWKGQFTVRSTPQIASAVRR